MIRQAIVQDIPAITSLIKSEPGMWQEVWSDNVIERALKSSDGLSFIWEDNQGIHGFISGHDVGFRGYLSELIVSSKFRRKGIGRQLVMAVQNELSNRGCHLLFADIWNDAESFYKSLDWEPVSEMVSLRKKELKIK
ncbi:MAG: GNAT family N-acetyltransferase [Desulfobacterium sp.]|nr:GNAT family N-acetyltransferase [Desulfobacteraceae bacterium]MBA3037159.1 GNAT family N-acetyltransferase [Desulfobacterium sp.]MBU4036960.1 GNAT family N-acetyltransferase [Pseudomonadota bacterium]